MNGLSAILLLALCTLTYASEEEPCPLLMAATGVSDSDKTGCYMVNLHEDLSDVDYQTVLRRVTSLSTNQQVVSSVRGGVASVVTVRVTDYSMQAVSQHYHTNYLV